jgi:hypothetical protein
MEIFAASALNIFSNRSMVNLVSSLLRIPLPPAAALPPFLAH